MKKKISVLIVVMMLTLSCFTTAFANDVEIAKNSVSNKLNYDVINSAELSETDGIQDIDLSGPSEIINVNDNEVENSGVQSSGLKQQAAQGPQYSSGTLNNDVFSGTSTLEASDPSDIWAFTLVSKQYLFADFTSTNSNYKMRLGMYDAGTGNVTLFATEYSSDQDIIGTLNAGTYVFYLYSVGSVGEAYNINYNYSVEYTSTKYIADYSDDFQRVISLDGSTTAVNDEEMNASHFVDGDSSLRIRREWELDLYGGSQIASSTVSDVHLDRRTTANYPHAYKLVRYTSPNTSTGNVTSENVNAEFAILLPIGEGSFTASALTTYQSGFTQRDYSDYTGYNSIQGRRFDSSDYAYGPHYIVYDIQRGKAVDIWGVLNMIYVREKEELPTYTLYTSN